MPRIAAVVLPGLRVEIARGLLSGVPLAVVIARPGSAVKDETSLLGNTRIDEVSPEARALGVHDGQTIAAARAKTAALRVRVVPAFAVTKALEALAEAALAFGPSVSFEADGYLGDVVWVDVTGCAHLFEGGESMMAERLAERVLAMGHACRVSIADGARVAAAVARYGRGSGSAVVVPPMSNASAMAALPLRALPLNREALRWLGKIGTRKVADLVKLPRRGLATRLGAQAAAVMALLDGDDRARLAQYVPPEVPEEQAELEYGIESTEALLFVCKRLADRLALRLAGRCAKAARLGLRLKLDRGLSLAHVKVHDPILEMRLASPLAEPAELLNVLRAKVDAYEIAAPILAVSLSAPELVASAGDPLHLFEPEAKADRALPRLTTELAAELGEARVGTLALCDTWIAEDRTRLVPFAPTPALSRRSGGGCALLTGGAEPSRLLPTPVPTAIRALSNVRRLARIETVEWWRRNASCHEVFTGWLEGARAFGDARGVAWVELDRATGEARVHGWMD